MEKSIGVLVAYKAKSTGLAPPVFISRRIVFFLHIYERRHNAMKVEIKGSFLIMSATSFKQLNVIDVGKWNVGNGALTVPKKGTTMKEEKTEEITEEEEPEYSFEIGV